MSLANIAAELFMKHVGGSAQASGSQTDIASALSSLLGSGNGEINLMDLVSKFQSGGLESLVSSWLGDSTNSGISGDQITNVLGSANIAGFASKLGIDPQTALGGLQNMIPDMVDQSSSGGSLLDSVGGIGGALNMAKKLFG